MYYEYFGLKEPPFKITPNTEVFFTGGNRGAVLDAIIYAILNGEGIIKVVGEVGSGKTMLCRMLQTMLPEQVESIYLANPSLAPEDILHAIAFELQIKLPRTADRLKAMQALQAYLLKRHAAGKQVVIFIEEAQGMPLATLEEIRLLSNLETNYDKLLQIVLFGQPELDENLNEVNIRQLRERITHSFHLAPFQLKEIGEYIMFRLRSAGYYGPPLFTPFAIKRLANAANGLVRRVNILADKALLAAFSENVYQVTAKHVQAAIADTEFGMEQAKVSSKKNRLLLSLVVLLLGLLLGYLASVWYQQNHDVDQQLSSVEQTKTDQVKAEVVTEAKENMATNKGPVNQSLTPDPLPDVETQPRAQETAQLEATAAYEEDILKRRLNATEQWLALGPETTVSIQLMGGRESPQFTADLDMLAEKIGEDNIYVYRTLVNNQPFLNILYGSFSTITEAKTALNQLPASLRKNRPQLRTIAGVLQETKQLP